LLYHIENTQGPSGYFSISRVTLSVFLATPLLVPVTVIDGEPVLAELLTVRVKVAVPGLPGDTLTLGAEIAAETPFGRLPTLRLTVPSNPLAEVTLSVVVAVGLLDLLTVRLAGFALMANDPPGVTVTDRLIE
jgi:hypothetical protein